MPLILLLLALTAFLTPLIFSATLGWALLWRVGLAVMTLAPLGTLLGMPFPTGLRLVADEATALIPSVWGVNGFFTVIGTVSALILGMAFGFRIVLLVAGLCYLLAWAAVPRKAAFSRA